MSFLHNLNQLPKSAKVCVLGKKNRNARFRRVLETLRPDIETLAVKNADNPNPIDELWALDRVSFEENVRSSNWVLITSGKYKQIYASLEKLNVTNALMVNQTFCHPFLQFEGEENEHVQKLLQAKDIYASNEDKRVYDLIISSIQVKSDLEETYHTLLKLYGRMGRQYFDFINGSRIRTIIEGGVADGRNTVEFLGRFAQPTVYGFEPDTRIFEESYFKHFLQRTPSVRIFPLGLWHKTGRLPFQIKKASTSGVSQESDSDFYIHTISIDEFVRDHLIEKVDFIKMDIEGSELEALRGAKETLISHRPQLAICIYHRLEHYYEIPLFLAENLTDYVFRIGHYSSYHVFSETILYGIPAEFYDENYWSSRGCK